MNQKAVLIALALLLALCLCGCSVTETRYFSYRESDFCAEVVGERCGICFSAIIGIATAEDGYRVSVAYLSPASLEGLEIRAECDLSGECRGTASVRLKGYETPADAEGVAGLILPASVLLEEREVVSVCRERECYRLRLSEDRELTLDGKGMPQSFRSNEVCFDVKWLECSDLVKK